MSTSPIGLEAFIDVTARYDILRADAVYKQLGLAALEPNAELVELDTIESPVVGEGPTPKDDADDEFDVKAGSYFDADKVHGFHLYSVEGGRILLTNELRKCDQNGKRLSQTLISASIAAGEITLDKFTQYRGKFMAEEVMPEDWDTVYAAILELGRVNDLLEERG